MTLSRKHLAIGAGALAAIGAAFAVGRFSRKVETTTATSSERASESLIASHGQADATDKGVTRTRRVRVQERKADGTATTTTTTDTVKAADLRLVSTWGAVESNRASEKAEATTTSRPTSADWRLGAAALWPVDRLKLKPEAYTVELDRRVLGPFSAGLRGRFVPDEPKRSEVGAAISVEW